tara:strand:+ start:23959 stop:24765 length:807 start_codon:yes stop_codon:yes gene_type:complete
MNKIIKLALITFLALSGLIGCGDVIVSPDGGEEAVLVKKPLFFGLGGVHPEAIPTGLQYKAFTTEAFYYNIKPMQSTEQFTDLFTSDNVPVSFNAFLHVQLNQGKTPTLHEKFGPKWYETKVKEVFRTTVRSFAKQHPIFKLTSSQEVIEEGQVSIHEELKKYVEEEGIPVEILKVVIGRVTPPEKVVTQTEETAAQKQRYRTETERAKAELARKTAEENRAISDKAYRSKFGMDTDQYIQLKMIEMLKEKEKLTIIMGGSSPIIGVK